MEIKKIFFLSGTLLFLNGCFQSTAMIGPAMTFVSTGNVYQAGFTLGANKAVLNETGMTTTQYVSSLLENSKSKNKREEEIMKQKLIILVRSNYEKTRKIILSQSLVRSNYEKTRKIILSQSKTKIIN